LSLEIELIAIKTSSNVLSLSTAPPPF